MAAVKRGLKRGLDHKRRSLLLMLDETIITETPPLYNAYGHIGEQVRVPITGNRAKRSLHGAINIKSGDVVLLITEEWVNETHQAFLAMIRSHWRGWNPVLFEDRVPAQVAEQSGAGGGVGDRSPVTAQGHAGIERDGSSVEARQETGGWGPTDRHRDRLRPGRLPVHHRPESSGTAPTGRCPVGQLLVNWLTKSAPGTAPSEG